MDSNSQWQQHRTKERLQQRMQEAEAHRLLKEGAPPHGEFFLSRAFKALFAGRRARRRTEVSGETADQARLAGEG